VNVPAAIYLEEKADEVFVEKNRTSLPVNEHESGGPL
jgi:hypothetical protein